MEPVMPRTSCELRNATAVETLAGIGIFRGLAADIVMSLSRRCCWRRYAAGQTIVQYQDEGRDVFFIVYGRACAIYYSSSGREVRFSDIPAGDLFGEFAAIDNRPRAADVVAVTDALIAIMAPGLFWEVLRRQETVCAAMLRRLTGIARASQRRVLEFSTLPVRSRLHAELARMARAIAPDDSTAVISPAPNHADLASRISTHREAVTRELNELARAKLIGRRGNDLVIYDTAMLESMVGSSMDEVES
jgi:CRP/FNR family transcriptional regulator, cyclic AMP receptor protein